MSEATQRTPRFENPQFICAACKQERAVVVVDNLRPGPLVAFCPTCWSTLERMEIEGGHTPGHIQVYALN